MTDYIVKGIKHVKDYPSRRFTVCTLQDYQKAEDVVVALASTGLWSELKVYEAEE